MASWASPAAQRPKKQTTHLGLKILTIRHAEKTCSMKNMNMKQIFRNMNHGFFYILWSKCWPSHIAESFSAWNLLLTHVPSSSTIVPRTTPHSTAITLSRLGGRPCLGHVLATGSHVGNEGWNWEIWEWFGVIGSSEKHALFWVFPADEDVWLFLEGGVPESKKKLPKDPQIKWDCSRLKGHQTQTHPQTRVFEKLQQQGIENTQRTSMNLQSKSTWPLPLERVGYHRSKLQKERFKTLQEWRRCRPKAATED